MKLGPDPSSQLALSVLERAVLAVAGQRLGNVNEQWIAQCEALRVVARSHSGVGFMTKLEVPASAPLLPDAAGRLLGAIRARHPALSEPAEFLIQLKAGRLATIEAFCGVGTWPADDQGFDFSVTR